MYLFNLPLSAPRLHSVGYPFYCPYMVCLILFPNINQTPKQNYPCQLEKISKYPKKRTRTLSEYMPIYQSSLQLLRLHVKRRSSKRRQSVPFGLHIWKSFTCGRRVGKHLLCSLVNKGLYGVGKHVHWLQISRIWQLLFMPDMKLVPWIMNHAAHCKIHP